MRRIITLSTAVLLAAGGGRLGAQAPLEAPGASGAPDVAPSRQEAPDSLRLSVDEAVRRAVTVNEDVLIARAQRAAAEGQIKQVRSDALPQISASFGYTRNIQTPVIFFNTEEGVQQIQIGSDNEYAMGLTLSQTVFDFSLGPARTAARLGREATGAQVEAARTQVALDTRSAYYDVLLSRRLVEVQAQALEQAERRLSQVEDFYRAGTASEFDLLTAQVEVDNLRPPLIEARNELAIRRNRLKRTISVPLDQPVALADSFPVPEGGGTDVRLDVYVERALERRADLRAQRIRVDLQDENLTAQERDALPTLELVAGLQRRASSGDILPPEEDFTQSASAGLNFSVPLFDGLSRSGQVQQAAAEKDRERYRLEQLRENIRLDVQQAHQALQAARERIQASSANVARAERALEIAQTRFQNGLSTQVELNDAELAVTEARTNRARALHAYSIARARLLAATGER